MVFECYFSHVSRQKRIELNLNYLQTDISLCDFDVNAEC